MSSHDECDTRTMPVVPTFDTQTMPIAPTLDTFNASSSYISSHVVPTFEVMIW